MTERCSGASLTFGLRSNSENPRGDARQREPFDLAINTKALLLGRALAKQLGNVEVHEIGVMENDRLD